MNVKNYTSTVPAERTVTRIEEALAKPAREAAAAKQKADAAAAATQAKKVADVQQKRSATPMTAKAEPTASKQVAWVAKHLAQSVAVFRKAVKDAETETARLTARISEIDRALVDPKTANASDAHRPASDLMRLRGEAEKARATSEAKWVTASEALEAASA